MEKVRTNVTLNEDVFKKAKKYNIIISSFLEIKLREYIALIEGKTQNQQKVFDTSFSKKDVVGSEGFEHSTSAMSRRRHNH